MTWTTGHALAGNRWDALRDDTPPEPPHVSVIVAHYRQPRELARTLHALARQDHPAERLQVIVADDGSPEQPEVPAGVELVRQDDAGFRLAAVRNLGVRRATGDILVFLDADTSPEPGFIRELTRLPALAPDCVTVGRRRHAVFGDLPPEADLATAAHAHALPEPRWLAEAYRDSRDLLDADDRSYRFVIGAVLACSRRLFDEVGGFDETFTEYGGEDWEWAYRAWARGAALAHVPTAVAWHDGPDAADRDGSSAKKNAEALRLAHLIPVPGSRARGARTAKVDIAVTAPPHASPAQAFVSVDGVLAAVPGAETLSAGEDGRFDRVRVRVDILRPLRVRDERALRAAVDRVGAEGLGALTLCDENGVELARIASGRAEARARRWNRDDLFPALAVRTPAVTAVEGEPDLEAYLGGW